MVLKDDELMQLTEDGSRFYVKKATGEFRPSVTYIQSVGYPTPMHLQKWKADQGWDEAEALKNLAGENGSIIHNSIEQLLLGQDVDARGMSLKCKRSIKAFCDWYKLEEPQIIRTEYRIWADDYSGTCDLLCRIKSDEYKEIWLVDYKSGGVYDTGKSQLMAYKHADPEATRCAILQLGNTTKKRYTWSEIKKEDEGYYWDLFTKCNSMYKLLKPGDCPSEPYPDMFSLTNILCK